LSALGATVLQRDWLSANNIVFGSDGDTPATVVDTGYARHAEMTLVLVAKALVGATPGRIVNTHLHSDHCGGNRALQARYEVQTWIPAPSYEAVRDWDQARLTYVPTGQTCERFRVDGALPPDSALTLGPAIWQIHAAPGHDPDAVMLFEPETRTLISGDALWEDRLAIIFPELVGNDGFGPTHRTLELIESLAPHRVIPGHGAVFEDVGQALATSRRRLAAFEKCPERHASHAARALTMFHMMEHQERDRESLERWLMATPIFGLSARVGRTPKEPARWAHELTAGLIGDGLLEDRGGRLTLAVAVSP
jgi:glyoxylase-like metal-dependent hydrolase (beta-lactamase superfamily II)